MMRAAFLPRLSPLLLLAAALVALAVFFAPGAQPAQAQTATTLSATLTAAQPGSDRYGCTDTSTAGRSCTPTGRLTDNTFNHNGVSYEIDQLFNNRFNGNTLDFSLTTAIPASLKSALTLYLDDRPFALADATTITDGLRWSNAGLSWVTGTTVKVVLTSLPAPAAATNLRVRPNDRALSLTWTAPTGTLTGYDVHYTSAAAGSVANDAAASGTNPAAAWVAVTRSGTTASQTIGYLTNGTPSPAGAPPAAATGTEGTLVSNTGQQGADFFDFENKVHAQAFTTGPYVDGYHLTGIEALVGVGAGLNSEDAATVRAEVWSDSNGTPGTRVVYMTAQNIPTGTTGSHTVTFVTSYGVPTTLAANTTYHFVIYTTGSLPEADFEIGVTRRTAEDAGASDGWSIADQRSYFGSQNTPPWAPAWASSTDHFLQIAVKGKPVSITHWSSTLAVKDLGPLAGDGCIGQQQCSDQLSPGNSFTHGAWPYNVLAVRVVRGSLQILLDRAPRLHPDQTRLDVGGRQFQFKDASESWGIDRNEDAWRLTWHGTGLDWSDGDTVPVSLVGWNVPAPPTPAPNTDLHPVRVHYDEMRDGEPVDNFNNLRLASPNPSGTPGRHVELRAYIPGTFHSADPEKGIVTTTHVMLRVTGHPDSTLEWATGNVYGVTGTFASFANGGFTPAIALNPASKWTYVYIKVTNGSQEATHLVAIDPPPRTYTLSPDVSVTEGEEAALTLSLGSPAGAGGVSFTVSADFPDGGATAEDVGQFAATVTVPEGQQSARIIIPTVDDEAIEEDEERFTVRVAHTGEPAWAVDPEGTATAVVTIEDNDEPPAPPAPPEGPEPWDIRVVPGDGTVTVTWNVGSRAGYEASEIWHVLRWSQEPGVWANPRDPRAVGPSDGLSVDPGLTGYTITGLRNGVATGVFVRSMVGHHNNMSERDGKSSKWVRVKGEHTTPVAPPNDAPTVSAAIADATIVNESGTHGVSLSGVFSDADGDALTVTASSSDESVATVSVAAGYSTLTVTAKSRGAANITVTASDGNGGEASDTFTVTVKAAPLVASAIADVSGLEAGDSRAISMSGVFSDADGDAVTITAASSDEGKVTVAVAANQSKLTVAGVAEGTATITVTAQDADGNSVSDAFSVSVAGPANNAPTVSTAVADATIVNESGTSQVSLSGVFSDSDGDDLTVTASSSDENVVTVTVASDHSTLTVSAQARGTATVTVTADDGKGGSVEDSFTVRVKAAPVVASAIADISGLEAEDRRTISISGVFSDADGDAVTVTEASSSDTSIAAVSAAIDGATAAITAVTVTAGSEGTATITVTARDADGNTVQDAFDVTVNAPAAQQQKVNNPPTVSGAIPDATIASESGAHEASLSGMFDDADGDDLTVTASSSDESVATVSVPADHSTLTVTAKSQGTATVTVTAADGYGGSVADSFTVRVKAAPVVASAIADVSGLEEGATRDVSLAGVFSDADGDSLTVTAASSDEGKATVSVSADGSKLTVSGVAEGTATITVTAQDADGNTVSDAFEVSVARAPEPEPEPVELPGPVGNLQLTATEDGVIVSWQAPESGDAPRGYIVHLKPEGDGKGRTKTPKAKKTKVSFDNLESGRTYKVWVRAQNEAGKGERVHASITLPEAEPPQDQGDQGEGEQEDGEQQDGQSGQ